MSQTQPINTIIQRDHHSRNRLSFEIDGLQMSLDFRKGGSLINPVSYSATSNGGIGASGLYEEWRCQGEVSVSKSLYTLLMDAYQRGASPSARGATHKAFAAIDGGLTSGHTFRHILLKSPPKILINEFGDSTILLHLDFSLNDLLSME